MGMGKSGSERVLVTKEISRLLNINYCERQIRLKNAFAECFKGTKISTLDLLKAIQRKNVAQTKTRSNYYAELQYEQCVSSCYQTYMSASRDCYDRFVHMEYISHWGNGLDYEVVYEEGYSDCMDVAYYNNIECLTNCEGY